MSFINIISVPTPYGIKTIEIHHSDITKLNFEFDILVISAFHNKYKAAPNTVIRALEENTGIIIENCAANPLIDLRKSLNCWVSQPFKEKNFKYILCVEGIKTKIQEQGSSEDAISDLFGTIALLSYKNITVNSIAMPLLGAGFQENSIEKVLPFLIDKAINSLNTNLNLNTIYFIEIDSKKARLIDSATNSILNRSAEKLEFVFDDPLVINLLEITLSKLIVIQQSNKIFQTNKTFSNLVEKITKKELRFFELGVLCRKLLEILIPMISKLKSDKYITLFEHLNELKSKNVADWMITYLHTLRVFGNSVAHEDNTNEIPNHMEKVDVIVFAHALNRFLDFYISFNKK
jgi:O-acetyl-ADP-ribose deacetylase (regulator of RNase III)